MKPIQLIKPGHICWVMDDYGFLKMVSVDEIYWDNTEEQEGWNIVSDDTDYWIECCFELEHPFLEN